VAKPHFDHQIKNTGVLNALQKTGKPILAKLADKQSIGVTRLNIPGLFAIIIDNKKNIHLF